jgi:hypothetical protein
VRAGGIAAAALSLTVLLLTAVPGRTQTPPAAPAPPPLPGFVPPYEITRIVRSAGFDPLAPPLRQGTTYVLRATDFRGILMRVVVDGHSGAIRAVNRIVADMAPYGPIGMLPPPYGVRPPYGPPGAPEFAIPEVAPLQESEVSPPATPAAALHPGPSPLGSIFPPLPRPRPAELASRKTADESKPAVTVPAKPAAANALPAAAAAPKKPSPPGSLPD